METRFVDTHHGRIAVAISAGDGRPVALIHGNSSCKEAFRHQFAAPLLAGFRLIALDLPGHGASDDARDPAAAYTITGYAETVAEVLERLDVASPVLFGWSLGGHIALEMIGRGKPAASVMISGTPPITPSLEGLMAAFNVDPEAENLTGKRDFSDADTLAYASHTSATKDGLDPHLLAMCRRTDGRARETMLASVVQGEPLDERAIVAAMTVPLAIVNGADDPFIQPAYFDKLTYGSLWPRGVVRLQGAGHAPFLQQPEAFNALLKELAEQP